MENEADAPPRLSPSERIWANSVISAIIIEQSDTPTLLALLRVNKVAFGLAVSQVYRSMRGPENTLKILRKVRNSTRCQAYARAVRHLSAANIYGHNIGYLCLSLPNLRSMSAPRVEKNNLLRLQWSVDACGEVRHAECVLSGLVKGDEWERTVAQSKALLPDDRRIQFRPALVVITDTASLARWIQSSQEGLLLPLKLFVDDLDLSCWDQVLAHIRTLPPTTHVVEELIVALGPDREEQSVARIPWLGPEMPQTVSILSKISKALTISGRPMRSAGTPRLHTALRSFRQVSFGIHLSCAKDTEDLFSWNVRPVLADVLRTSLQRHPIRFIVTAWLFQAQRPADSLSTILAGVISDRQWLWALARSLRQAASCFSRHQLKIVCIGYPDESKHAEAIRKASVQLTDRLNDTIEIISQCARDMQPRSFEKVSRHRPPSVQSDPTGDHASRVSIKGQHVDERESGQNLEAAAAVAEEDRTS